MASSAVAGQILVALFDSRRILRHQALEQSEQLHRIKVLKHVIGPGAVITIRRTNRDQRQLAVAFLDLSR